MVSLYIHCESTKYYGADSSIALDRCLELMAEDPDRQRRRAELLREREKLTKAQEWLDPLCRDEDEETLDHEDSTEVPNKSVGEWDSIFA